METYPPELAEAVRNRRRTLGVSQQAVMDKSKRLDPRGKGVHTRTLSVIENGSGENYRGSTLSILDRALDWPQGTCWSVFIGLPVDDATDWDRIQKEQAERTVEIVTEGLTEIIRRLRDVA